jgi:hypothetical protein
VIDVAYWHKTDITGGCVNVRCRESTGRKIRMKERNGPSPGV